MSSESSETTIPTHNQKETSNVFCCQKVIKDWIKNPELPSSMVIPSLHQRFLESVDSYRKKGLKEVRPGEYRNIDIHVSGEPENFYVRGLDATPVMSEYCKEFDRMLSELPKSPVGHIGEIIHSAAWAYYVFIRIHPFYDANGRTGRHILKRVIVGSGLKDLVFYDQRWDNFERSEHLDAMNNIDKTGNLSLLELYLLKTLLPRYKDKGHEQKTYLEIKETIRQTEERIKSSKHQPLSNIWSGFKGLDVYGE